MITVSNVGNIHMKDGMTYAFDGNGEITKAEEKQLLWIRHMLMEVMGR